MRSTRTLPWPLAGGRPRSALLLLVYAGVCGALGTGLWAGLAVTAAAVAGGPTTTALVVRLVVTGGVVVVAGLVADPILDRIRRDWNRSRSAGQAGRSGSAAVPADRSVRP